LDTTLVNRLEENITWFNVCGDEVENIEMYHEHKDRCIREEDGPQKDEENIEMGEQASSADIEMGSEYKFAAY
jgi:hypothetical protein